VIDILPKISCDDCSVIKNSIYMSRCSELGACWLSNGRHPLDDILMSINMSYFEFHELINPLSYCFEIKDINKIIKNKKMDIYLDKNLIDVELYEHKQHMVLNPKIIFILELVKHEIDRRRKERFKILGIDKI
jgi:hypothetical protein